MFYSFIMKIEVSNGEIVDKHTILIIKYNKITDELKLKNIKQELAIIDEMLIKINFQPKDYDNLLMINETLWDVEDELRLCEENKRFDDYFIALARQVYHLNDERAAIKKKINIDTNSQLTEEKSYKQWK
jgi:hypothetical protein